MPGAQSSDRNVFVANLITKTLAAKINDIWETSNNIPSKIDVDRFHEQLDDLMKMNYLVMKLAHNPRMELENNELDYFISVSSNPVDRINEFGSMAFILADGAQRAVDEIYQSYENGDRLYILHHKGLLYDICQEFTRLANESCSIVTERLLEPSHPHVQLLERRLEEEMV